MYMRRNTIRLCSCTHTHGEFHKDPYRTWFLFRCFLQWWVNLDVFCSEELKWTVCVRWDLNWVSANRHQNCVLASHESCGKEKRKCDAKCIYLRSLIITTMRNVYTCDHWLSLVQFQFPESTPDILFPNNTFNQDAPKLFNWTSWEYISHHFLSTRTIKKKKSNQLIPIPSFPTIDAAGGGVHWERQKQVSGRAIGSISGSISGSNNLTARCCRRNSLTNWMLL